MPKKQQNFLSCILVTKNCKTQLNPTPQRWYLYLKVLWKINFGAKITEDITFEASKTNILIRQAQKLEN